MNGAAWWAEGEEGEESPPNIRERKRFLKRRDSSFPCFFSSVLSLRLLWVPSSSSCAYLSVPNRFSFTPRQQKRKRTKRRHHRVAGRRGKKKMVTKEQIGRMGEGKKSWIRMQMIDPSAHSPPLLILVETNPLIHAGEIEDIRVGSGRKTLQRLFFMFLGGVPPNLSRCPKLCVSFLSQSRISSSLALSAITEIGGGERETLLPPQNCFLLALPFFWPTQKAANYSGTSHLVQGVG